MIVPQPLNTPEWWSGRAITEKESWEAAGWSRAGQLSRFFAVLMAIDAKPGESLLDFGCGTGAFADVIPDGVDYVGCDTSAGMIVRAAREHPDRRFSCCEPYAPNGFDITVCIGPFNLPAPGGKENTWHTLRRLWDGTGRVMAVSLYAGHDPNCVRYTLEEVVKHLGGLSHDVTVERWRPNDIMAVVTR